MDTTYTQPAPLEPGGDTTFPADLTRGEYIRFQELLFRNGPSFRLRTAQLVITAGMLGICILFLVMTARSGNGLDISLLLMVLLLVLMEVYLFVMLPRQMRVRAGRSYDQSLMTGYRYEGLVTVGPASIRKTTAKAVTEIPFAACTLYIEAADMLVFGGTEGRSIVLPARCLTGPDAALVRQMALTYVPGPRQRLYGRLVPGAAVRLPEPDLSPLPEEDAELSIRMEYTEKEFIRLMTASSVDGFIKNLPNLGFFAFLLAMSFELWMGLPGVPVFLLVVLGMFLAGYFTSRARAGQVIRMSGGEALRLSVDFTPSGLTLRGSAGKEKELRIPWKAISRAVERPDRVDFYTHSLAVTLPKRCIEDLDALKRLVDDRMPHKPES